MMRKADKGEIDTQELTRHLMRVVKLWKRGFDDYVVANKVPEELHLSILMSAAATMMKTIDMYHKGGLEIMQESMENPVALVADADIMDSDKAIN